MSKLSLFSFQPKEVKLPNGSTAYIRKMSALDRVNWWDYLNKRESNGEGNLSIGLEDSCRLLVSTLVDKDGKRLLTDEDADDVKALDADALDTLTSEALTVNNLTDAAVDDTKKK